MVKTKTQFDRLEILHGLLIKRERIKWTDIQKSYLLNEINVSRKTIFNDLRSLKEDYHAPIQSEKGKYYYSESYSYLDRFSVKDYILAEEITTLLNQFAEFPAFKGLEDVWVRLTERIQNPTISKECIVQFEQNEDYRGLKRINQLYEAIKNNVSLKIKYQDFEREIVEYSISPYLLKEYHNRWHIYGYEHKKEKIYNLALDRIEVIENSVFPYRLPKKDDLSFLDGIVGFTYLYDYRTGTYAELETVKIRVASKRANYIRTKPLHTSQQELIKESTEQFKVFCYYLRFNNELLAKLLEFGKDLEVIEPPHLREKVIEQISGMITLYGA